MKKKKQAKKHRHTWRYYDHDSCQRCGYVERFCTKCTVFQGKADEDKKWVEMGS